MCLCLTRFLFDMGKLKDITSDKKIRISALLATGNYSQREIAKREGVSRQTVQRIAALEKENIPSTSTGRSFCGSKRKTTGRVDRQIVQIATTNRMFSCKAIQKELSNKGVPISERTIRRRLYEAGLKCRRPVKKPKLTPAMKKARYRWAKQHKNYTIDDWRKVR